MSINEAIESANINSKWLMNIFENIKNIEVMERYAHNGCVSVLDYLQIPQESRQLIIADTQFKNLSLIVTEISLLLGDLTPVMEEDKIKIYIEQLSKVKEVVRNRSLFVHEPYSQVKNRIISSEIKPSFYLTLDFLSNMRNNIIKDIAHLLYMKGKDSNDLLSKKNNKEIER